jgi:hypothetical protein
MAQDGTGATGKHGRLVAADGRKRSVPRAVDATMDPVQPSQHQPVVDCRVTRSHGQQLAPAHDSMLSLREVRDREIEVPGRWHTFPLL